MAQQFRIIGSASLMEDIKDTLKDDVYATHQARKFLEVGKSLTFEEIESRIDTMEKAGKLTVSSFTKLGFNLDTGNFATCLDDALKLVQVFAKGDPLTEFTQVIANIKTLGFNRVCSQSEQRYYSFGVVIQCAHTLTIALINFKHQNLNHGSGFLGFKHEGDTVNCLQVVYKLIIDTDELVSKLFLD